MTGAGPVDLGPGLTVLALDLIDPESAWHRPPPDLQPHLRAMTPGRIVPVDPNRWHWGVLRPLLDVLLLPQIPHEITLRFVRHGNPFRLNTLDGAAAADLMGNWLRGVLAPYEATLPADAALWLYQHRTELATRRELAEHGRDDTRFTALTDTFLVHAALAGIDPQELLTDTPPSLDQVATLAALRTGTPLHGVPR